MILLNKIDTGEAKAFYYKEGNHYFRLTEVYGNVYRIEHFNKCCGWTEIFTEHVYPRRENLHAELISNAFDFVSMIFENKPGFEKES